MSFVVYLIALCSSLIVYWRTNTVFLTIDYSYYIENAYRIFLGQHPYKDFLLVVSPGTYVIGAWIMRIFGTAYIYQKLYIMIISFVTVLLTYKILQHINPNKYLNLILLLPLIFSGHASYAFPSYDMNTMIFILLSIYLTLKLYRLKEKSPWSYFMIGLTAGIAPLFKQNTGLGFTIVTLMFIAVCIVLHEKAEIPKKLFMFALGIILPLLVFCLYLIIDGSFNSFMFIAVTFPLRVKKVDETIVWVFYDLIRPRSILYYLPFVVASIFVVKKKYSNTLLVLTVLYGTLIAPVLYAVYLYFKYRSFISDLTFIVGFTLLFALAIWFLLYIISGLLVYHDLLGKRKTKHNKFLSLYILYIIISTASVFSIHRIEAAVVPFYPIFAILLLYVYTKLREQLPQYNWFAVCTTITISTTVYLLISLLNANIIVLASSFGVLGASGEVKYIQNGEFANSNPGKWTMQMEKMMYYVKTEIPKKDTVIAIPGEDPLYYETKRTPPLPYYQYVVSTFPYTPADYVKDINSHKIGWVIVKTRLQHGVETGMDISYIEDHIKQTYFLKTRIGEYDIYKRK